ncbi:MAG TPA: hypothetical protein VFV38_23395 [Ktedonobacteraceae bacterium]|nr:hypothetical protein [Ktedonobacteraceae bacterium]
MMEQGGIDSPQIADFLLASKTIHEKVSFEYAGAQIQRISPLAQGYGLFSSAAFSDQRSLHRLINALIGQNKTIVLEQSGNIPMEMIAYLCTAYSELRIIEVIQDKPFLITPYHYQNMPLSPDSRLFLLTESFLHRRFLHQRLQSHNILFRGQEKLPLQHVHFVGVGPAPELLTASMLSAIQRATYLVMFDRTFENIIKDIPFAGQCYLVRYNYEDFAANLLALNLMLATLQTMSIAEVTVLVEGDPEIYDFAEGLSTVGRKFTYEAATPLVLLSCQLIEQSYSIAFLHPGYVLTSGFNVRQGITTAELLQELSAYLECDLTCMVMEMYCGDIPLILAKIQEARRAKSVLILTNMFSQEQRIYFLSPHQLHMGHWAEQIKGKFTTLVIIDESRLPIDSPGYLRLLNECGPYSLR